MKNVNIERVREILAAMTDDPEVCHTAEEVAVQMPITASELAHGTEYNLADLVRWAAHDLTRNDAKNWCSEEEAAKMCGVTVAELRRDRGACAKCGEDLARCFCG